MAKTDAIRLGSSRIEFASVSARCCSARFAAVCGGRMDRGRGVCLSVCMYVVG